MLAPFMGQPPNVLRIDDGAVIPPDEDNGDYRAFLAWVAEGNEPDPAPAPPPAAVPSQISRWQAWQIMLQTPSKIHPAPATLFSDVQAIVTATGGLMQLAWVNQQYLYRNGPFIGPFKAQVGLSDEEIDALFIAAQSLPL
jgi:hypothetical protein